MKHKIKVFFISATALAAAVGLLVCPKVVSQAVKNSVADCLEIVIPSLFSFTVLALWLQNSGVYRYALKFLTFPLSRLLKLDEELCAVLVLSNIGGYPTGVKLLSSLVEQGRLSKKDAGRMLCCCFGSGPSFIIGLVGLRLFRSMPAGGILFGACFVSSLVVAAAVRLGGEIRLKRSADEHSLNTGTETLISSVMSAARVMLTVCVMIVAFSVVTALLKHTGLTDLAENVLHCKGVLSALLEVTRISEISTVGAALPVCAALLCFGGVCVHLQVSALSNGMPVRWLLLSRLPAMAVSALLTLPFAQRFPMAAQPVAAIPDNTQIFSGSSVLSVCVIFMCIILLSELRNGRNIKD